MRSERKLMGTRFYTTGRVGRRVGARREEPSDWDWNVTRRPRKQFNLGHGVSAAWPDLPWLPGAGWFFRPGSGPDDSPIHAINAKRARSYRGTVPVNPTVPVKIKYSCCALAGYRWKLKRWNWNLEHDSQIAETTNLQQYNEILESIKISIKIKIKIYGN